MGYMIKFLRLFDQNPQLSDSPRQSYLGEGALDDLFMPIVLPLFVCFEVVFRQIHLILYKSSRACSQDLSGNR